LSLRLDDRTDARCILNGLDEFREHLGGRLTIMLLRRVGEGFEVHEVDERKLVESITLLKRCQASQTYGGRYERSRRHMPAHATAAG
jgi:3-dehydroquinate synthetase